MSESPRPRLWFWLLPVLSVTIAWASHSLYQAARSAQLDAEAWVDYNSSGETVSLNWRTLELAEADGCCSLSQITRSDARKLDGRAEPLDPRARERVLRSVGEVALLGKPSRKQ